MTRPRRSRAARVAGRADRRHARCPDSVARSRRGASAGVELEDDAADLDVVAGLEALRLERGDHAHAAEPVLDVRERLLTLEVVAGDEAVDRLPGHPVLPRPDTLDAEGTRRSGAEDAV